MNKKSFWIDTPLGPLLAIADDSSLYALEFTPRKLPPPTGRNSPIDQIEQELNLYFEGKLQTFSTPLSPIGTPFQKDVWEALEKIPYGETISYSQLAINVNNPRGYRAVAQANGRNPLPIIIPCHRVINKGGGLGGYSVGIERKQWLLELETQLQRRDAEALQTQR